jgi:hypothetical protein
MTLEVFGNLKKKEFSILNAYILISERFIAFKLTLEPSSDTFEKKNQLSRCKGEAVGV